MSNPFDQFDEAPAAPAANPFDQFDAPAPSTPAITPQTAQKLLPSGRPRMQVGMTEQETTALRAGLDRSLRDVVDRPAAWLAQGADALGLTAGQGDTVAAGNTADRQAFDAQYGQDGAASLGRIGGQVALTLPVAGALGKVAGAAGETLAAGTGEVAPMVGRAVQGVGNWLGGTAGGAGGAIPRAAQATSIVANGAIQGGATAALTAGQSDASVAEQATTGAAVGGAFGPAVRGLAAGVGAAKNAIGGGAVNPEVARLAQLARDKYGIELTLDQISPSPFVQTLGSQLRQVPGSGMAPAQAALQTQFTKAVGRTIGEEVDQITPAVMERARDRIGGVMNDVAAKTTIVPDKAFRDDLLQITSAAQKSMPAAEQAILNRQVEDILQLGVANGGVIPGKLYQTLTGRDSAIATSMRTGSPAMQEFSGRLRATLDEALERSAGNAAPETLAALRQARLEYKNLKTIEPLVVKGEAGEISPTTLQGRVNTSYKGRGLRADQPDLAEIADIGRRFNLVPDSKTAGRSAAAASLVGAGSIGTSLMSGSVGNALLPLAIGAGTVGAGRVAGNMMRNPVRINKLLPQATMEWGDISRSPEFVNRLFTSPGLPPQALPPVNELLRLAAPVASIGEGRIRGR